jgi:hypothetical protein
MKDRKKGQTMATCSVCNDGKRITVHGLRIHMGKIHGVHYGDAMVDVATAIGSADAPGLANLAPKDGLLIKPPTLVPCPCLFCREALPADQMRHHWDRDHPTWKLHTGLYTWEV